MFRSTTKLIITGMIIVIFIAASAPKAHAMEPISMSIAAAVLLPIALQLAKAAMPYVIKGATNFGGGLVDVFVDMAGLFMIPFGFFEATLGSPLGLFTTGLKHMGKGCLAPFKMTWSTVILPVRIFTG